MSDKVERTRFQLRNGYRPDSGNCCHAGIVNGVCVLEGSVKGRNHNPDLATLPEWCRPKGGRRIFNTMQSDKSTCRIDITTDGRIYIVSMGQSDKCSLTNIVFAPHGTAAPTAAPTATPTFSPTGTPSVSPTFVPSSAPSVSPTFAPSSAPSASPTSVPTVFPTAVPTVPPTDAPTSPTAGPTNAPWHVGELGAGQCDYGEPPADASLCVAAAFAAVPINRQPTLSDTNAYPGWSTFPPRGYQVTHVVSLGNAPRGCSIRFSPGSMEPDKIQQWDAIWNNNHFGMNDGNWKPVCAGRRTNTQKPTPRPTNEPTQMAN